MEAFEEWALSKELDIRHHSNPEKGFMYYDIETQMFWECWQASRLTQRSLDECRRCGANLVTESSIHDGCVYCTACGTRQ